MAKDELKIKRKDDSRYDVTNPDGSKDTFKARRFLIQNGYVEFYDKMDKLVKTYSSDADIEVK